MRKFGSVQKKILLALLGGAALGLSSSPKSYFYNLRLLKKEWKSINQNSLGNSLRRLSRNKLVEERVLSDGSFQLVLTEEGKTQAKELSLYGSCIKFTKPKRWDGKWRVVLFDIPENDRKFRDVLRAHLYELKFYKLQNSVFVSPYPFEKPILELIELYSAKQYVRVITAISLDNQATIKRHFKL